MPAFAYAGKGFVHFRVTKFMSLAVFPPFLRRANAAAGADFGGLPRPAERHDSFDDRRFSI